MFHFFFMCISLFLTQPCYRTRYYCAKANSEKDGIIPANSSKPGSFSLSLVVTKAAWFFRSDCDPHLRLLNTSRAQRWGTAWLVTTTGYLVSLLWRPVNSAWRLNNNGALFDSQVGSQNKTGTKTKIMTLTEKGNREQIILLKVNPPALSVLITLNPFICISLKVFLKHVMSTQFWNASRQKVYNTERYPRSSLRWLG